MQEKKKELLKNFKLVVEDLLDNYDKYTDEEKAQIKEVFQKVVDLNTILDKYDDEKKAYWAEFFAAYGEYFRTMY